MHCCMPIVLGTQEDEAGGSLERLSSRPTWAAQQDPHLKREQGDENSKRIPFKIGLKCSIITRVRGKPNKM